MCRVFKVHFSGFYAWLRKPFSTRAIKNQRLLKVIRQFYVASGATYGSPWIHRNMREAGETCSVHRVARIMRENKLKVQIGSKRRYIKGGKLASVAENHLDRNFSPDAPNRAWMTVDPNLSRTESGNVFSHRTLGELRKLRKPNSRKPATNVLESRPEWRC